MVETLNHNQIDFLYTCSLQLQILIQQMRFRRDHTIGDAMRMDPAFAAHRILKFKSSIYIR